MIGEEVRRQREELGLTGAQLAARAGLAPSAVSQIETGKRSPSSMSVMKLADALGVEVGQLYPKKAQAPLPLEEPERGVTPGSLLSAEWALSLADEDTFQQAITNALSQDLRSLVVDLVGSYQPRLFEDVRGKKPSPEDARRVRAFTRAHSIAEVLRQRGEEAPESYVLALRRHMDATTSPETHHLQEGRETA